MLKLTATVAKDKPFTTSVNSLVLSRIKVLAEMKGVLLNEYVNSIFLNHLVEQGEKLEVTIGEVATPQVKHDGFVEEGNTGEGEVWKGE